MQALCTFSVGYKHKVTLFKLLYIKYIRCLVWPYIFIINLTGTDGHFTPTVINGAVSADETCDACRTCACCADAARHVQDLSL